MFGAVDRVNAERVWEGGRWAGFVPKRGKNRISGLAVTGQRGKGGQVWSEYERLSVGIDSVYVQLPIGQTVYCMVDFKLLPL